jgi:phosphomethylpyrimidine synthase
MAVDANDPSEDNFCSTRITQEVRDFAAKQNSESYLASEKIKRENGEDEREVGQEGMEEMHEKYREGGDLNMPSK